MPGRSCFFFADNQDLMDLLERLGDLGEYKYVEMFSELNEGNRVHTNPVDCFSKAIATPGFPHKSHSYIVLEQSQEIFTRKISMKDGSGSLFVADQNNNWNSIVIAFGGDIGDNTIVESDVNTVGDTEVALAMHTKFKKMIRKATKNLGRKGQPEWFLPGAIDKARIGWRFSGKQGKSQPINKLIPIEKLALD